jgi:hypothetical protein
MKTAKYKHRGIEQQMLLLTRPVALPLVHRMNNLRKVIVLQTAFGLYFKNNAGEAGHAMAQFVEALHYRGEGHGFDFRWGHWDFSFAYSFRLHNGSGIDSASNRNENQGSLLG